MAAMNSLVSVIIRTTGRATLARSMKSVFRQTHRPIEIVLVNAGGTPLPRLASDPTVEVREVGGGPFGRPQACNAGLDAARGEWLVFLDDDDAYLPQHIETLLEKLAQADGARVAYSATACIDGEGRTDGVIHSVFDREKLLARNYIQIGAALFNRSLVQEGCRFDERLDCMEDWDFWIQLAQRTDFAYTAKATNVWFAFTGESGSGMGPNQRPEVTEPYKKMVLEKWKT